MQGCYLLHECEKTSKIRHNKSTSGLMIQLVHMDAENNYNICMRQTFSTRAFTKEVFMTKRKFGKIIFAAALGVFLGGG